MRKKLCQRLSIFNNLPQKGFTLIELIVAFSIISILSSIGLASFVNYSNSQVVQGSTSDLMSTINVAKARAGSQLKPTDAGCSSSTVLNGYGVKIDTVNNNYYLYADCSGNIYTIGKTQTLPKGMSFEAYPQITTTNNIFFSVLTNGVQGSGFISLNGYNLPKCIIINDAGVVQQVGASCAQVTPTPTQVPSIAPTSPPASTPTFTPIPTPRFTPTPTRTPTPTPPSGGTSHGSQTLIFTGGSQIWTVPTDITSITIDALGAGGGDAPNYTSMCGSVPCRGGPTYLGGTGGKGGEAKGTFSVAARQIIYIYVGGYGGWDGFNGGGSGSSEGFSGASAKGGGATDVRIGGTRVLVAAGGGGGGGYSGQGGGDGQDGGNGGGTIGANASGRGGTQSAGGAAGLPGCGTAGASGIGGNGTVSTSCGLLTSTNGGGGGGGYFGGGGGSGGSTAGGGGGGGGSSFVSSSATNTSITAGVNPFFGQVTITY